MYAGAAKWPEHLNEDLIVLGSAPGSSPPGIRGIMELVRA
jgi:hypothetical protein